MWGAKYTGMWMEGARRHSDHVSGSGPMCAPAIGEITPSTSRIRSGRTPALGRALDGTSSG